MTELLITIPGEPCAQGRPRFSTAGGFVKAYDPAKSRNYKAYVKLIAQEEIKKPRLEIHRIALSGHDNSLHEYSDKQV